MKIIKEIKISDNGFVFNSNTGDSFSLNSVGLELIKLISQERELEEIKEAFTSRFDVDELTFEKDFYEFCFLLKIHRLIAIETTSEFD
jgi:hypothetical protein